jgi:hypothetical protein
MTIRSSFIRHHKLSYSEWFARLTYSIEYLSEAVSNLETIFWYIQRLSNKKIKK